MFTEDSFWCHRWHCAPGYYEALSVNSQAGVWMLPDSLAMMLDFCYLFRLTIAAIQIGAYGEVQPFDTG